MACLPSRLYGFKSHYPQMNNFIDKDHNNHKNLEIFYKLFQLSIKKGKKSINEKNFRNMLFFLAKKQHKNLWEILLQMQSNILPIIDLRKKRKGYKIIYMSQKRRYFLSCYWILKGVNNGTANKFTENLAIEILNASQAKGFGVKQQIDHNTLVFDNIKIFVKKK